MSDLSFLGDDITKCAWIMGMIDTLEKSISQQREAKNDLVTHDTDKRLAYDTAYRNLLTVLVCTDQFDLGVTVMALFFLQKFNPAAVSDAMYTTWGRLSENAEFQKHFPEPSNS